ncbi:MAG TPA: hypothetical protein VFS43_43200 [Polyangiaceae bacterium]|nr:hypothetical protein [Polyangiaceae bacterium]
MRAEQGLDRGIDVEEDLVQKAPAERSQTLRGHQPFERGDVRFAEAGEVAVDGVEARHDAAGQADEERVGRERFEPEDARFAGREGVHQEAKLGGHGGDDGGAVLERAEGAVQGAVDAFVGEKGAEGDQARDARERRVRGPEANPLGVGALNRPVAPVAVAALASEHVAAHLLGARRREGCGHRKRQHDRRRAFLPAAGALRKSRSAGNGRPKGAKRTIIWREVCAGRSSEERTITVPVPNGQPKWRPRFTVWSRRRSCVASSRSGI